MKRLVSTLAIVAALASNAATAQVVTAVTPPLPSATWTDIGTGPLRIWASGRARYAISDATPAAGMAGFPVSDDPIDVTTTSDVWVISAAPQYVTQVFYAPVTAGGGGGGGGGAVTMAANAVAAGAYKSGSFVSGALADGSIVTLGTEADTAWATGSGTAIAILKTIAGNTAAGGGAVSLAAGAVHAGAYLAGSVLSGAYADGAETTIGTEADAAWASGNGTVVAILKKISGNTAGSGGLAVTDESAFTAGSSQLTPVGGIFYSTIPLLTNGQQGAVALTNNRNMFVDVLTTSNLYLALTSGVGTPGTGPAPTTGVQVMGVDAGSVPRAILTDTAGRVIMTPTPNVTPTDCSGTITSGGTAQSLITAAATIHGFTVSNVDSTHNEPLWISFTGTAAAYAGSGTPTSTALPAPAVTTFSGQGTYTTPYGFGTNHAVSIVGGTTGHGFTCTFW